MSQWVRVADASAIAEGTGLEVVAEGHLIAVYKLADGYCALDGVCPHAGGPLAKGQLDGSIVTCPWHGWQFDVRTGRHCLNNNLSQPRFPVKVEEGAIWVEVPSV